MGHRSREGFLAWEATQPGRWELIASRKSMKVGGTVAHNRIAGNVYTALDAALGNGPCAPFQQNQKLAPAENDDVTYPDVFVTCRPLDDHDHTVASATVIVEVLSPSTRADDMDAKWSSYQRIADLRHYLLIESAEPAATLYSRVGPNDDWNYRRITDPDAVVELPAIGVAMTMRAIYRRTAVPGS